MNLRDPYRESQEYSNGLFKMDKQHIDFLEKQNGEREAKV
jgi:hypothetical protein